MAGELRNGFPDILTEDGMMLDPQGELRDEVQLLAGQWVEVGRLVVPHGVGIALGTGEDEGLHSAQGRLYMDLRDNGESGGNPIDAPIRFDYLNPNDRPRASLWQDHSRALRTDPNDPRQQRPLPTKLPVLTFNWRLVLLIRSPKDVVLSRANSTMLIPLTRWDHVQNGTAVA